MIVLLAEPVMVELLPSSQLMLPLLLPKPKVLAHANQVTLMPKNILMRQQPLLIDPSAKNAVLML
jgi:hypothetical protein